MLFPLDLSQTTVCVSSLTKKERRENMTPGLVVVFSTSGPVAGSFKSDVGKGALLYTNAVSSNKETHSSSTLSKKDKITLKRWSWHKDV